MQKNRDVLRQVGGLAVALLVCIAVMLAVYALLGRLDRLVLLGAVFGWILAVGNFLSLSITVSNATVPPTAAARRKRSWRSRHPAWCARWCWR